MTSLNFNDKWRKRHATINYNEIFSSQYTYILIAVSSWKLSRQRTLSNESAEIINSVIDTIPVLRQNYYELQRHTDEDCFYFPEPVVGEPVVFPGQCNNDKLAVPAFDLNRVSLIFV